MIFFHRLFSFLFLASSMINVRADPVEELKSILDLPGVLKSLGDESTPLIVFDIHGTLVEARGCAGLGSDAWVASLLNRGVPFSLVCDAWSELQISVKLLEVEPQTSTIVNELAKNHAVIALTGGLVSLVDTYHESLVVQGIDLSRSRPPFDMNHSFNVQTKRPGLGTEWVEYRNGILAVGPHVSKGEALARLFELWNYQPRTVVFVDDNQRYLMEVSEVLPASTRVLPLHYTGSVISSWFLPQNADEELLRFSTKLLPDGNACAKVFDFLPPFGL